MKNNLRILRKKLNLKQDDLAQTVGVTRQTINAIENNKYDPTLKLAMRLALFFNTSVEKVFILD